MNKDFRNYVLLSFAIHVFIFFFLIKSPHFTQEPPEDYKVTWIRLSKGDGGNNIRSNLKNTKDLPTSTLREQKMARDKKFSDKKGSDLDSTKAATKSSVVEKYTQKRTATKGAVNLNKKKPVKKTRIDDALARIENQLKQREVQMTAAQVKDQESGQSIHGSDKGSNVDPALVIYYNSIKRRINSQWVVAKKDFVEGLKAQILVRIDERGNILRSSFRKGSGDGSFDNSAMRAIQRSAPFPIPPHSIRKEAINEGFMIEFNPNRVN